MNLFNLINISSWSLFCKYVNMALTFHCFPTPVQPIPNHQILHSWMQLFQFPDASVNFTSCWPLPFATHWQTAKGKDQKIGRGKTKLKKKTNKHEKILQIETLELYIKKKKEREKQIKIWPFFCCFWFKIPGDVLATKFNVASNLSLFFFFGVIYVEADIGWFCFLGQVRNDGKWLLAFPEELQCISMRPKMLGVEFYGHAEKISEFKAYPQVEF